MSKWVELQESKGNKIVEGIAASPGMAVGQVRNVHEHVPELMAKIQPGEVVVGYRFKAEHCNYVKTAAALVTDSGGVFSAAAFMARTYGLPAVTGTTKGTSILKNGQKVVVDGAEGAVYTYKDKAAGKHK